MPGGAAHSPRAAWLGAELEIQFQNKKLEVAFLLLILKSAHTLIYQWLKDCMSFSMRFPLSKTDTIKEASYLSCPSLPSPPWDKEEVILILNKKNSLKFFSPSTLMTKKAVSPAGSTSECREAPHASGFKECHQAL